MVLPSTLTHAPYNQQDLSSLPSPVYTEAGEDIDEIFDEAGNKSNTQPDGMLDQVHAVHKSAALPISSEAAVRALGYGHTPGVPYYITETEHGQ